MTNNPSCTTSEARLGHQAANPGGWCAIESAPQDGTPFLAYRAKYRRAQTVRWLAPYEKHGLKMGGEFVSAENDYHLDHVWEVFTHWTPLPPADHSPSVLPATAVADRALEACIEDIKSGLCCPRVHGCEQNDGEYCLVRQSFARAGLIADPDAALSSEAPPVISSEASSGKDTRDGQIASFEADHLRLVQIACDAINPPDSPDPRDCGTREYSLFTATFTPLAVLALLNEIERLKGERDDLRLAICGGEDAPGYNASFSHETILLVLADNYDSWRRDSELAWDGETATSWKARAQAAETQLSALKGERDEAVRLMSLYAREAGEATGRLEMSEAAGIVDGWRERAQTAEARVGELIAELQCACDTIKIAYRDGYHEAERGGGRLPLERAWETSFREGDVTRILRTIQEARALFSSPVVGGE